MASATETDRAVVRDNHAPIVNRAPIATPTQVDNDPLAKSFDSPKSVRPRPIVMSNRTMTIPVVIHEADTTRAPTTHTPKERPEVDEARVENAKTDAAARVARGAVRIDPLLRVRIDLAIPSRAAENRRSGFTCNAIAMSSTRRPSELG